MNSRNDCDQLLPRYLNKIKLHDMHFQPNELNLFENVFGFGLHLPIISHGYRSGGDNGIMSRGRQYLPSILTG